MERIIIKDISLYGYHGVLEEEQKRGQEFLISVELELDRRKISQTDRLENTLDYSKVLEKIKSLFFRKKYRLLETLAELLAEELLQTAEIKSVQVSVKKPHPPLPTLTGGVEVSISRSKKLSPSKTSRAYLGLGSNQGNRWDYLQSAVSRLQSQPEIEVISSSPVYETEPVGLETEQNFYNAALMIETSLSPVGVLQRTKEIEWELGRRRKNEMLSRVIDIDLLHYDKVIIKAPLLSLPHPSLSERWFVLVPLNEICPHLIPPGYSRTVEEMLELLGPPRGIHQLQGKLVYPTGTPS